ncbi:MAG: 6-carboxytetrahydropterin synthase, partial [Bacteriovoracia bacterium]
RVNGNSNNHTGPGHNSELEVVIAGEVDRETGMNMNHVEHKQIMHDEIIRHVDHKHLNEDVDFLRGINPTAENLVVVFWKILSNRIPRGLLHEVRLRETENNISIYRGE